MDYISKVKGFHNTFDAPVLETSQIPSEDRCRLRVSLLQEELDELKLAITKGDIVEVADALCDLQYVLSGAVLEFGLGDKFEQLFNEVQRSNMSKACSSIQEALMTISHYKKRDGVESMYKRVGDKWVVYRMSDNKILKSINYSPVNLQKIIVSEATQQVD
jgi:predicted HAD superfamily Cof-like phosphohydrolase